MDRQGATQTRSLESVVAVVSNRLVRNTKPTATMVDGSVSRSEGSSDAISRSSSCQAGGDGTVIGSDQEPASIASAEQQQQQLHEDLSERAESEAVKLLDEELAELEQLMGLQRKKVDALERLRQQWLSGARYRVETMSFRRSKCIICASVRRIQEAAVLAVHTTYLSSW